MSAPFSLSLRRSPLLQAGVFAAHVCPLAAAWTGGLELVWLLGVAALVSGSAMWQWREGARLAGLRLRLGTQGEATVIGPSGEENVALQAASRDLGWLLVLVWQDASGRFARVAIARDGVAPDAWRRLRRIVRWLPRGQGTHDASQVR